MTLSGWLLIIFSWVLILGMASFCFKKTLVKKELK